MYRFTEDCMTGIFEIDEEHRQLFDIINETLELAENQVASVSGAKSLLRTLKKYAELHFAHEEEYMEKLDDPELPRQRMEHQSFVEKLESISPERLEEEDGKRVLKDMLEFLSRWLYHHILGSDIMIGQIRPVKESEDPFAFTEKYRTGIKLVDEEHATLFQIIREANDLIQEELVHDKYDEIIAILDRLKEYTVQHFRDEEEYMSRIGYAGLAVQQMAHQAFVDKLNEINLDDVDDNQQEYLTELVDFLLSWLVNHILKIDKLIPVQ